METPIRHSNSQSDGNRRAMNSTAYRIYKLLQWLIEGPLSVPMLNEKFCQDPRIGKSVSTDSVWLYVNTLKALGCRIRRPSLKNQFRYELLSHPFGLQLTENHFDLLSQAKAYAQQHFNHQEALALDRLLKKIVNQGNPDTAAEAIELLFAKSRSYDYAGSEEHLKQLEQAIEASALLQITYTSPLRGKEGLVFLPHCLFYEQGVMYARGERVDQDDPSNLRLERILGIRTLDDEPTREALLRKQNQKLPVSLQITISPRDIFNGFGLSPNQGIYDEQIEWLSDSLCNVHLQIRESFYLKQRLLASEHLFKIIKPLTLRDDLKKTLEIMCQMYEPKEN